MSGYASAPPPTLPLPPPRAETGRAECTSSVASGCNLRRPLRGQALTNYEIEIKELDEIKA